MLRYFASGFLTRKLARPISRAIPNPILRTLAIAAVGYGVERLIAKRVARPSFRGPRRKPRFA